MPESLPQSILCPVLIGRDAQVAALARLLDQASAGHGQIALISGEAGIGKSRLVAAVVEQAQTQGFLVWRGNSFETDRTLPYALLLDLCRTAFQGSDPSNAALLSQWQDDASGAGEESKRRWFAALLERFAVAQPHLIICEDLHWADDASLEFLTLLARRTPQQPALLIFTLRSDEITPSLTRWLATLDRQRVATELILAPLTEAETDQMVRTLFQQPQPIRSDFLYTIHSLSEGNPFLIEEMLKALVATGAIFQRDGGWERKPLSQLQIPRTVQAALQSRLVNLSNEARRLLRLAAVIGRRFDFSVLQLISQRDEVTLLEALRALLSAQLIVEESAESFTFRHALIREAVYTDLLWRERNALHLAIGNALEAQYPGLRSDQPLPAAMLPLCADLAYHFFAAEQWAKALRYSQQAGEWAQRLDAPQAAISHLTHAIAAAQKLDANAALGTLRFARAQAAERLGEFESARLDYETALAEARTQSNRPAEWQNLLALGFLWTGRSYQQAETYFQAALHLAHQQADPLALARTLNRVGNWYLNADEPQRALAYHQQALSHLQTLDEPAAMAETLDLLGTATYYSGDLPQAVVYYQRAIAQCHASDQRSTLVSSLLLFAAASGPNYLHDTLLYPSPNPLVADQAAQEALHLCRTMQWRQREAFVLAYLAWSDGAQGRYAQAFAHAQSALQIASESEFHQAAALLALALLHWDVGDYAAARQWITTAQTLADQVGARMIHRFVAATAARIYIASGQLDLAAALLQQHCPPETPKQSPPQRLLWLAWAEFWLANDQPAQALALLQTLSATPNKPETTQSIPLLQRLTGEALLALRRFAEAEAALQSAAASANHYAALPIVWRSTAALARLYRSQRRSNEAETLYAQVSTTTQALSPQLPTPALQNAFAQLVNAHLPAPKTPTIRQSAKQASAGLTAREREVASLVAQGKSNLEIAHSLTLTERTVESHISNILAKLHFTNRSQIAAWAVARGLNSDKVTG
jgi:predicted ATPase/DNA-binding CsgD family transcriptional regulator